MMSPSGAPSPSASRYADRSSSVIGSIIPPRERGRYFGYLGVSFAMATVSGPLIGGLIVDTPWLGWRWTFFVCVPLAVVALIRARASAVSLDATFSWSTLLVVALAALTVGIVFGTYPARRAGRLSPIDAILSRSSTISVLA